MSSSTTSDTSSVFASRPDIGTKGKLIALFANHFPLKFDSDLMVYHYDVDMEPIRHHMDARGGDESQMFSQMSLDSSEKKKYKKLNNKIYRIVVEEAVKQYSRDGELFHTIIPAYDGQKNLYTTKMLNLDKYTPKSVSISDDNRAVGRIVLDVNEDGRDMKYALNLKFASAIDMNALRMYFDGRLDTVPSDALQVLNIVLRHGPTLYKIPIGNSLYLTHGEDRDRKDIGNGVQLAYGYFQSVRPGISGVNLVIDRTATAMYDCGYLPKFIAKLLNMSRSDFLALKELRDSERNRVKKELTGIMVQVKHLTYKRKYKVIGITQLAAERQKFTLTKTDPRGQEVTLGETSVVEFFRDHYNKSLQFAHLPCIIVGSVKKPNYIPLEMCELVADQHVRKNLTNDQMVEMIRESASQLPAKRLSFIQNSAKQTINDSKSFMEEFGIQFVAGNTPLKLDGRVLQAPVLSYGMNKSIQPFDGKWDMKMGQFYRPAELKDWFIIGFSDMAESRFDALERELMQWGSRMGMRTENAVRKVKVRGYDESTIPKIFSKAKEMSKSELRLIVFVISARYQYLYESIKKIGDVDNAIVTQCIKEASLNKLNPPLVQNILLKINTKLGGINTVFKEIECLKKRTMIVGVDSSHPGVNDRVSKSVSACVSSLDDSYVKYYATTRLQKRIQELSTELHEMMAELIKQYVKHNNGFLPEQIIIYRDGVSEGQFNSALQKEIREMSKTFRKEQAGYEPKLTYIVVQKRHHTRFFPVNSSEGVGRAKNVPPGLVVDTDVVSKTHFDYFLCSHEGIQGTSRPTHYYVLWDENNFSSNELQQITYNLTHVYVRCTRSISYPAPVAYAHLAAYRAQRHIIGLKQCEDSDTASIASSNPNDPRRHRGSNDDLEAKIKLSSGYGSKMYFC